MDDKNKEIANKLKSYLFANKIQHKEFAEKIGVTPAYFSHYISGRRDIQNIFIALHTKANIDLNWLVSGQGSMFSDTNKIDKEFNFEDGSMNDLNDFLLNYLKTKDIIESKVMSSKTLAHFFKFIEAEYNEQKIQKSKELEKYVVDTLNAKQV